MRQIVSACRLGGWRDGAPEWIGCGHGHEL